MYAHDWPSYFPLWVQQREAVIHHNRLQDGEWYRDEEHRIVWIVTSQRGGSYGQFATRAEAEAYLAERAEPAEQVAFIDRHLAGLPETLTRADYEARCAAAGVEVIPDGDHYFGVYSFPEYTAREVVCLALAVRRMTTWHNEQAARRRAAPVPAAPVETFICTGCGGEFPRALALNASLGIACPDCYDDLAG